LRAQERVESRLAHRPGREETPELPEWWPEGSWRSARAELERAAERSAEALRSAQASARLPDREPVTARVRSLLARRDVGLAVRAVAAFAVLAVLVVQVLGVGRGPSEVAAPPAASGTVEPSPVSPPPAPPVAPAPVAPAPVAPAPDGVPEGRETLTRVAPPVSLRVPAIEVDARIVVVGLEPDGAMEIPSDVRTVGWYDPFEGAGVAPGEPGTAVIAGHVDSRTQGRGAFWSLRDLVPGDVIDVEHADGTSTRWQVESVVRYPKTDIPIVDIFTFEGDERLALITCGGEFDRSSRSYLDNYVVTAVPLRTAVGGPAPSLPAAP
jgi:hypothetical protein